MLWVFDLDGTLVDSAKIVASILNDKRVEMGLPRERVAFFYPWLSLGGDHLVANALSIPREVIQHHLNDFRERYVTQATPPDSVYPGVFDFLTHLTGVGASISICTNKPRNLAEKVLRETGLGQYIDFICAGGDLATQKPHPENLRRCLLQFDSTAESAVMVGDSTVDQKIAAACGVSFCFFSGGYDDGVDQNQVKLSFDAYPQIIRFFKEGHTL
jgi:phosphoglycolate phosphatase